MKALLKRRHVYVHKHTRSRLRRRMTSLGISFTILLAVSLTAAGIANARRRTAQPDVPHKTSTVTGEAPHVIKKTNRIQDTHTKSAPASTTETPQTLGAVTSSCADKKTPDKLLSASNDNLLRKVAEYDAMLCDGSISSSFIFTGMPQTNAEADEMAQYVSSKLASFAEANIAPIVIVEPTSNGQPIDLASLQNSGAGSVYEYYLTSLKAKGTTDSQAGTWVFFPEPNIPEWSTVDPAIFTANLTTFGQLFKEYFPNAKLSVLLDSTSYTSNSYTAGGARSSLLPYISGLPPGLVDSLGYQGFPWTPAANETGAASTDAADFLKPSLAVEAAHSLGVNSIWLNTGSFASYYTKDPAKTVTMTAQARATILDGATAQAASLQKSGFNVSLNLFAQNKSTTSEAADWSYWPAAQADGTEGAALFSNFASKLHGLGIKLGVFDTY